MTGLNRAIFFANFLIYLFICFAVLPSISAYKSKSTEQSWSSDTDNGENSKSVKSSEESMSNEYLKEVSESNSDEDNTEIKTDEQYKEEQGKQKKSDEKENQECGEEITTEESYEEETMTECPDDESDDDSGNKSIFQGAFAPVYSPTDENNELNFTVIPAYIKHLRSSGVKGILVAGTVGEGATMSMEQRKQLLEVYLTEARKNGLKVIAQIGGTDVPDAMELARHAQEVKADAIMSLPQIYYRPKTIEQLVGYLELLSNCAPKLPIFYYDNPKMSGVHVNIRDLFKYASAEIPMFIGVKASYGAAKKLKDLLRCKQKVFVSGSHIFETARIGFDTRITTMSNLFMDQVNAIQDAVNNKDYKKGQMLQDRLDNISREIMAIGKETVPILKATMGIITNLDMGPARSPQMKINKQQKAAIRKVLKKYNVEIKSC